ncbi:MAG: DNA repair protein RadA [Candidatus Kapaibacterium sp.]
MVKTKTIYECQQCGATSPRWAGKCTACGAWNSFVEKETVATKKYKAVRQKSPEIVTLESISTEEDFRIMTGISELDRVLGGGIIPGSLVLVGGDPGIGKSTLMLQMCGLMKSARPLYITGEESLRQIKFRSGRLASIAPELLLMAETNLEQIDTAIRQSDSQVAIVDSIQSIYSDAIEGTPGSIVQVRECAARLMQTAKSENKSIFIVGHVTKEGVIAGPKILEHMVDTVLHFEGEKNYAYRILRARKNRFGSTNELGIFEMTEHGLREVLNPSEVFLARRQGDDTGVAIVATIEGTRPIMLEVQALVGPATYGVPQRAATGVDNRRLQMILAVLEKRLGLQFRQNDVFVNIAGGIYLNDPSIDLGIAAALVSSFRARPVDPQSVIIGEIGLTGEIRAVSAIEQRISEAQKLGFKRVVLPKLSMEKMSRSFAVGLAPVERISLALDEILKGGD